MKPFDLRIDLEIGNERREGAYKPTSADAGVEWCIDYTRRNRGCKASLAIIIPSVPGLIDHSYILFECSYPKLHEFMEDGIREHHGRLPFEDAE